ncbi:phosphotransferase [uncultured Nostoc sp.]|uniref:phosphotransferase n=1 Tax=uncultured Nostoc sp. TaxID=340711 RepID=UPI0035CA5F05
MPFLLNSENVSRYLLKSNLCAEQELEFLQVEAGAFGKNFNLLVTLSSNCKLLVKQERHWRNGKTANEFFKEWQFHKLLHHIPELSQLSSKVSELLHFDESNSIIVYKYLLNYLDLDKFYRKEQTFPAIIATSIGRTLAVLHGATINQQKCSNFISQVQEEKSPDHFYNPAQRLERIGPEVFGSIPDDCLKFLVLYQRYESLGAAVAELTASLHPCCVIHNDLKLDNILLYDGWEQSALQGNQLQGNLIRLIDWERCTWGDPAFDLGTILASYLRIWLDSLVAAPSIEIEESLRLAMTPLKVLRPSIVALMKAYLENFPEILKHYSDFLQRVVQFAGLALIETTRAFIDYHKYFGNRSICMLQVAKSLLCRPEQSMITIFGISESELACLNSSPA